MLCAGFFLFAVQPFKLGDHISVSYTSPAAANSASRSAWFEGTCEKVDLRSFAIACNSGCSSYKMPVSGIALYEVMWGRKQQGICSC